MNEINVYLCGYFVRTLSFMVILSFQGQVNVTKTGIPCQKWDSQKPHTHIQPPKVFRQVQNAENYCRNAGGEEPSPWCYTMNESVRWQLCDIPLCRKYFFFVIS